MKPSEMTTEELMRRMAIGDASEMANEMVRRADHLKQWLEKSDNASVAVAQAINEPCDEAARRAYYEKLNAVKPCEGWCSTYDWPEFNVDVLVYFTSAGHRAAVRRGYCTPACRDAGHSLCPPVTP